MLGDKIIFEFLYSFSHKTMAIDWFFIFLAKYVVYLIVLIFIFNVLFKLDGLKKKISIILLTAFSIIISRGVLTEVIRFFYNAPRPFDNPNIQSLIGHESGFSFPSGHMTFLIPIALWNFSINKKLGIWLSVLTILVGLGRVTSGVHYPIDIFGGIVVGVIGFYSAKFLLKKTVSK